MPSTNERTKRITVSQVGRLGDASLSYSSLAGWRVRGRRDDLLDLMDDCWRTRAYGDFWSYMLVAEGAVDIATEPDLAVHDMAALVPIVQEAGGRFTGLDGRDGCWSGNAVATRSHGCAYTPGQRTAGLVRLLSRALYPQR